MILIDGISPFMDHLLDGIVRELTKNAKNGPDNGKSLWHSREARAAVGTLRELAGVDENTREMWKHTGARAALLEAAAVGCANGLRKRAVNTLQYFTCEDANAREIWAHTGARAALLEAAAVGSASGLQKSAVNSLCNLARDDANARAMWVHVGLRMVLLEAAEPGAAVGVREGAVFALLNLASEDENLHEMWDDEEGTRYVLLMAATAEGDECSDLRGAARRTLARIVPSGRLLEFVVGSFEATRENKRVKLESETLAQALECVICLSARRDMVLLPCRHLAVCGSCCGQLRRQECPICRAPIEGTLSIIAS